MTTRELKARVHLGKKAIRKKGWAKRMAKKLLPMIRKS